jgi:hypothetical protein
VNDSSSSSNTKHLCISSAIVVSEAVRAVALALVVAAAAAAAALAIAAAAVAAAAAVLVLLVDKLTYASLCQCSNQQRAFAMRNVPLQVDVHIAAEAGV